MSWRFSILVIIFWTSACKTGGTSEMYTQDADQPVEILLTPSKSTPTIDSRPFQFWMHKNETDPVQILATNRSNGMLSYVSKNSGIDIRVSEAAVQCMKEVFRMIEREDIKSSAEWKFFTEKYPFRFLEPLPELRDFYTFSDKTSGTSSRETYYRWLQPVLWNGFNKSDAPLPGQSGFKLRGYLKWGGVLLPDGVTCLVTKSGQMRQLLASAMKCEGGEKSFCSFPTEELKLD